MKIKEIKASLSGVIPIASYENLRPTFEIAAELEAGDKVEDKMKELREIIRWHFEQEGNNAKADLISKQYAGIRFYEKDGKKYPSVTSILSWNTDWKISEDELQQYASRGTIVHKLIENYLGSAKWADCSYMKAIDNIMADIKILDLEKEMFNDEHLYAGRTDMVCLYKGKKTVLDFKTGTTSDMRQLAAYAVCLDKIEQLVILPVGPTDNKSGFKKPIVSTDIAGEFKKFTYARMKFRERFGI